jgi:cytochrome P450
MLEERKRNPELRKGDFLDVIVQEMKTETFLTDNFVISMMFGLLLASFETISSTLTLAIKLINDNPKVVQQLTVSDPKFYELHLKEALVFIYLTKFYFYY